MSECSLHSGLHTPDRAFIRNTLHQMTAEVTDVIAQSRHTAELLEPTTEIHSYENSPDEFPETYQKATNHPAFNESGGYFESYVTTNTTTRFSKPLLRQPFIPIGQYGQEPAERLLIGAIRTLDLAEKNFEAIGTIATRTIQNKHATLYHTFPGHMRRNPTESLVITAQVGVLSTAQSLALLSAETIPDTNWDQLVGKLVEQDKITEFARRIGSGLLPFLVLFGRYISPPLKTEGKTINLSPQLISHSRDNARAFRSTVAASEHSLAHSFEILQQADPNADNELFNKLETEYRAYHLSTSGGTTCPAANRGGEIKKVAQLILDLTPSA